MATKTVHSLNYKLLVDSSDFEKGMVASRSELAFAKREMRAMQTPAEKLEVSLEKLGKLAQKDAKFQELYNRKLKESRKNMGLFSGSANEMAASIKSAAMAYLSFQGIMSAGRMISDQIDKMDALAKAANNIGASTEFLSGLEFTANRVSGFGVGQATKAIQKMTIRVAQAAKGTGEAKKELDALGLSAKNLVAIGPEKMFFAISRAMDDVVEDGERMAIAMKIFDDEQAGIHKTMQLQTNEWNKHITLAEQLGAILTENQKLKAQEAKDQLEEFRTQKDSLLRETALASTPYIKASSLALKSANAGARQRNPFQTFGTFDGFSGTGVHGNSGNFGGFNFLAAFSGVRKLMGAPDVSQLTTPEERFRMQRRLQAEEHEEERENNARIAHIEKTRTEYLNIFKLAGKDFVRRISIPDDPFASVTQQTIDWTKLGSQFMNGLSNRLPDDPFGPMAMPGSRELTKSTSGPMDSIAAGSGEAFKLMNQTTAVKSQEIQLQKSTLSVLEQIRDQGSEKLSPSKEYAD